MVESILNLMQKHSLPFDKAKKFPMSIRSMKRWLSASARELRTYARWLNEKGEGPRLLIFPSQDPFPGSSNLRDCALGQELATRGWRVAICSAHLRLSQRHRIVQMVKPDIILLQTARHPLNRPRYYPGYSCVFDLDDADFLNEGPEAPVSECIKDCVSVIAGSTFVANWCARINPRVHTIWTGTTFLNRPIKPQVDRPRIVTWSASAPVGQKDEADFLVDVIARAIQLGGKFKFRLYADNGSDAYAQLVQRFRNTGCDVETIPNLTYDAYLTSLDDVMIGLNPMVDRGGFSSGKSFGKALGYLERGVASINDPTVDHPLFFDNENGLLASGVEQWADEIIALLNNPVRRQNIATAGRASLEHRLSIRAFTDRAEAIFREILLERGGAAAQRVATLTPLPDPTGAALCPTAECPQRIGGHPLLGR